MSPIYEARGGMDKRGGVGGRELVVGGEKNAKGAESSLGVCSLHTTHMRAPPPWPRRWHSEGEGQESSQV